MIPQSSWRTPLQAVEIGTNRNENQEILGPPAPPMKRAYRVNPRQTCDPLLISLYWACLIQRLGMWIMLRGWVKFIMSPDITGGPNDPSTADLQLCPHVFCNKSSRSLPSLYMFGKMRSSASCESQKRKKHSLNREKCVQFYSNFWDLWK